MISIDRHCRQKISFLKRSLPPFTVPFHAPVHSVLPLLALQGHSLLLLAEMQVITSPLPPPPIHINVDSLDWLDPQS